VRRLSDKYINVGREWDRDFFVQASYQQEFLGHHRVKANAKYTNEYLRYCTDYPENQNTARVDNHYRQEDGYGALCYGYMPWTWLSLSTSYDVRYSKLWADLKRFSSVFRLDQKEVVAAQMNLNGVQAAVSMLHQHLHDFTNVHAGAADPLDRWTPAVSLAYTFNPSSSQSELTLRAWYKKIFRAPTLNDLYYTQVGNRDLQPEYTKQWNIGMEYHWNNRQWALNVQADAYQNKIENRIVCLPLKGTYTWTMMNYGYTFCQGLNATASGRYQLRDWQLSLLGTLTWQRDVNRTDPNDEDTYDKPICYSPRLSHTITAIAAWRQLSLTVSHMYVGERMWSYADPEDILKPYHNIDAKLSYSTTIGKTSVGACLEIIDLLDEQYEHIPRYPMPGRNYKLTLTFGI
jgi:outer membrane receptor protein involved in Fe transport